ncbi:MAG: hypothetical protein ACOCZB_06275 [Spirochaetota bacterium]
MDVVPSGEPYVHSEVSTYIVQIARRVASVQYGVLATWIEFGRTCGLVDAGRTAARLLADAIVRRPLTRRNT